MNAGELRPRSHLRIDRLVLFEYRLTCRTGLHIGTGKSADLTGSDQPVLRDRSGRPLVPGSSLRGVLRAGIESFSNGLDLDAVRSLEEKIPEDSADSFARRWQDLDLVKRLFGAAAETRGGFSYGSRLQISDALCLDEIPVELRDGVGIDRERRTAAQGIKFDLEVVPAGTRFQGRVRIKNPADYELGLLAQALWMLDQGLLLLGGKSARGLGWVQVEVSAPRSLDARSLLGGASRSETSGDPGRFGPVENRLGEWMSTLPTLAAAAASTKA
ncbi:MAG: CRISPR-associated RAMP protein Csx7 [Acidobacteriota bacterium]